MTGSNQGEPKELHRFRELFFICRDNLIIHPHYKAIEVYADREHAERACRGYDNQFRWIWDGWPGGVPNHQVEAFRLVHSSLYDKILKQWDADAEIIK